MLNTSLLNETTSVSSCLKNTGQRRNIILTSKNLLPTPTANKLSPQTREDFTPNLAARIQDLKYLQEDSLVNLSQPLDSEKERQMIAISGQQCLSQLDLSNQTGSSLRMLRGLLLGTKVWFSNKCVLTWKVKVTKSSRLLYQLAPSTRRIEETGSGLLPTATARDNRGTGKEGHKSRDSLDYRIEKGTKKGEIVGKGTGLKLQPAFVEWMMGFPEGWTEIPDSKLLEMRSSRRLQKKSLEEFL